MAAPFRAQNHLSWLTSVARVSRDLTKMFDFEAALFSVKSLIAAILAYYIALRIGLNQPGWAVTTSYIISQPLAGAVLSKAFYRFAGTLLGAAAAVVLVPAFVNEPIVLSVALSFWLGFCIYLGMLDRTPRSYVFLLAGYTVSLIGFPSVNAPDAIFNTAILRVQEITLAILCASLVHGAVFPRTITARLLSRLEAMLASSRGWTREALRGEIATRATSQRRTIARDLAEIDQTATHVPFDTARLVPRVQLIRAFQDQLGLLLPMISTVEERLIELRSLPDGIPSELLALIFDLERWLEEAGPQGPRQEVAKQLIEKARLLEPSLTNGWTWHDLLCLNLLSRLEEVMIAQRNLHDLLEQIRKPTLRAVSPAIDDLLLTAGSRLLHRDRSAAFRAALSSIIAVGVACTFWISTSWRDGAGAISVAGVVSALFAATEKPSVATARFLTGNIAGIALAAFTAFVILPRATDFVTLVAVIAPTLLVLGSLMARPPLATFAIGAIIGFINTVGIANAYQPDFGIFVNSALATVLGVGFAAALFPLFQSIGKAGRFNRLLRACFKDVALRAEGRAPNRSMWVGRMLDRLGLLADHAVIAGRDPTNPVIDTLQDIRTGVIAGDLARMCRAARGDHRVLVERTLTAVAAYYRKLDPRAPTRPDDHILEAIDEAMRTTPSGIDEAMLRDKMIALTSLRRNLFPQSPGLAQVIA